MLQNSKIFMLGVIFLLHFPAVATDHNEPNQLNAIFTDVESDPADLYGLFAYPGRINYEGWGEKSLVLMMTFAPAPRTGEFDPAVEHRIYLSGEKRAEFPDFDGLNIKNDFEK